MARKTPTIVPETGGGILPKIIGTVVLLALAALVVKHPGPTAEWVKDLFAWATSVIDGVSAFLGHIGN
ncbi:hypothetical protein [Amycolatopsis sp. 195334CR]|uniref:hypothetical protein n=1 Tax=Amycolatopsis sp. 195334CR TaxID=2814588 RepID=UPI001A8EFFAB|nr:hypothetical protein [Amycolatopsis sp. 195334CR]MBN6036237.1 hypothetical protein [Amycolatopsis sp. 195334CR]